MQLQPPGSETPVPLPPPGNKESIRDYCIQGATFMLLFTLFFLPGCPTLEASCQATPFLKTAPICPQDVLVNFNSLA